MEQKISDSQLKMLRKDAESLHSKDKAYQKDSNIRFLIYIVAVLIAVFSVRLFVAEPVMVDGDSMYPTLLNTERMLVDKTAYWFTEPQRGDIVTCFYPGYTVSCVKRVIGLPGETVEIKNGDVYIDGVFLDESAYLKTLSLSFEGAATYEVPEGHVFVMGDNRGASKDSRAESVGPIPYNRVIGRCRGIVWPLSAARSID